MKYVQIKIYNVWNIYIYIVTKDYFLVFLDFLGAIKIEGQIVNSPNN